MRTLRDARQRVRRLTSTVATLLACTGLAIPATAAPTGSGSPGRSEPTSGGAGAARPATAPRAVDAVTSLILFNADTDQPIAGYDPIPSGATLNLATLPTRNLNVRAVTSPGVVGSVRFAYDANSNFRTESAEPYFMAGDEGSWTPTAGSHTITATPYTEAAGAGTAGTAKTVQFTVTDGGAAQAVTALSLYNMDTQAPVAGYDPIPPGATIDLAAMPTRNLNVQATASPATVGSVRFGYDANASWRVDEGPPYTLNTTTAPSSLAVGSHTVTATPFTGSGATGTAGTARSVQFTVTDGAASGQTVARLTLYNADTDQPIPGYDPIPAGATLDLTTLPTRNLNVRAVTSPSIVGSVRFAYDANVNFRTESTEPYFMAGDEGQWTPTVGSHTVTATPYTQAAGGGTAGTAKTVQFSVVDAPPGLAAPVLSTAAHNGDNRSMALCGATCFEVTAGYTTPAYVSMDTPRAVTLAYVARQAHRTALVQVDAQDNSSEAPDRMSLKLLRPDGTWVTYPNGETEAFFNAGTGKNRLAVRINEDFPRTGAYYYTAVVTSHWTRYGARREAPGARLRVLYVDAYNSPYGWGWGVAGVQKLHLTGFYGYDAVYDSLYVWDGAGSVQFFRNAGCGGGRCSYAPPAGEFSRIEYIPGGDAFGAMFVRTYPDGSTIGYDPQGRQIYASDRLNNRTMFAWLDYERLASITDPAQKTTTFGYVGGKLRTITDPAMRVTTFTVDAAGDLTQIVEPGGRMPFRAQYDQFHLLAHSWDARGGQTSYAYDTMLRLAQVQLPSVRADGVDKRPTIGYQVGETAWLINWWDGSGRGTAANPSPRANPDTVRTRVTDPRGFVTTLRLDRFGAPLRVEEPLGRTTVIARDDSARVTRVQGPSGHVVKYVYQGSRLVTTTDSTTGRTVNVAYGTNPYDLPERVYGDVPETHYRYNARWLVDSTWVTGRPASHYTYDARGRVATVGDPEAHPLRYEYRPDGLQNLERTVQGSAAEERITRYTFNAYGLRDSVVNPKGEVTRTEYDALNRVRYTWDALGRATRFEYDSLYLTAVVDPKLQRHEFGPNALGWVEWEQDPLGRRLLHGYDAAGNQKTLTNRRQQSVSFTYDALGQLTSRTADGVTTAYRPDPLGRWSVASNDVSTDSLVFDAAGRVTEEWTTRAGGPTFKVASSYDVQDRRRQLAVGGWSVRYHYDALGQLDTLVDVSGRAASFDYNFDGQRTRVRWPSGIDILSSYPSTHTPGGYGFSSPAVDNALGVAYTNDSLTRVATRLNNTATAGRRFGYDGAGRLKGYTDFMMEPGACTPIYRDGADMTDDPPPQPIDWTCLPTGETQTGAATYDYDAVGNRLDNGAQVTIGNRLEHFGNFTLQYDLDGNLLYKMRDVCPTAPTAAGDCHDEYIFNSLGQLVRAWKYDDGYVYYGYDGWGRRVRRTHENSGTTTHVVYDGDDLLLQAEPSGHVTHVYTYQPGVDEPHSVLTNAVSYYYQQDRAMNVTGLVDQNGGVAATYAYEPFGRLAGSSGGVSQALGYKGREAEPHTGLVYMRARWYDPDLGRFISEDPIGLAGGINPYAFAGNDPVNGADPSGTDPCTEAELKMGGHNELQDDKVVCKGVTLGTVTTTGKRNPPPPPLIPLPSHCALCDAPTIAVAPGGGGGAIGGTERGGGSAGSGNAGSGSNPITDYFRIRGQRIICRMNWEIAMKLGCRPIMPSFPKCVTEGARDGWRMGVVAGVTAGATTKGGAKERVLTGAATGALTLAGSVWDDCARRP